MTWPVATDADRECLAARGFVVVPDAVDLGELALLAERCLRVRTEPGLAIDWSYGGKSEELRDQVFQSMLELVWIDWQRAPFARWTAAFAAGLMGADVRLWYNQLLDKPPRVGAPTHWHQDGASLGLDDPNRLISAWMALDDVDLQSGCMHFADGGHRHGILAHSRTADTDCGVYDCVVDEARVVAAPLRAGGVTFHLGATPHMTTPNRSDRWRQVVIQRFTVGPPPGMG